MVANDRFDEGALLGRTLESTGASHVRMRERPGGFEELASLLAACRVTITTSYHVALVSLYVGTPVVALCESEYYRLKFGGLSEVLDTPLLSVVTVEEFGRDVIEAVANASDAHAIAKLRDTLVALRAEHAESRAAIARALERRA
jgi:colanic acid/amylovoran biosynthesis protein